jgi:hypothetical protein
MISWDAAVQIDGNTTEEKQAEINSLRTFFKGFEDMLPVERECLERGKEDGHIYLQLRSIETCFVCGAYRPLYCRLRKTDGVPMPSLAPRNVLLGYICNRRLSERHDAGLFCAECEKKHTILSRIKGFAKKRNIPLKIEQRDLISWKE